MLTKDILFGINLLTLLGFVAMGLGLTMRRMANAGLLVCSGVAFSHRELLATLAW
ncbi:MAG TPA: hypothetical protein VNY74_12915 [Edaphobacter sp.]|jgi:hypothetical protein|nr:hypothetical protein [Edaphobacter sp.]